MLRWQPHYRPLQKLREALNSKRAKRRLIVAVARRLAIDLWRWATKRATAQELGLRLVSEKENASGLKNRKKTNLGTARVRA
jgi:hypothetical protein